MKKLAYLGILLCVALAGCNTTTKIDPATSAVEKTQEYSAPGKTDEFNLKIRVIPPKKEEKKVSALLPGEVLVGNFDPKRAEPKEETAPVSDGLADAIRAAIQSAAAGSEVQIDLKKTTTDRSESKKVTASSKAKGIGVETNNPDVIKHIKTDSPDASLEDVGESSGGASDFVAGVANALKGSTNLLLIFGGLLIAGGVAIILLAKELKLGAAVGGAGVSLIVTAVVVEKFPWVILILALAILGALGYFVYDTIRKAQKVKGFKKVVEGLENASETNPAAAEAVKTEISKTVEDDPKADYQLKTVVYALKKELGL